MGEREVNFISEDEVSKTLKKIKYGDDIELDGVAVEFLKKGGGEKRLLSGLGGGLEPGILRQVSLIALLIAVSAQESSNANESPECPKDGFPSIPSCPCS